MDLHKEILKLTCQLYGNLRFSRTDVQFIIELMQTFVGKIYNPHLYNELCKNLYKAVDDEVSNEIQKTFDKYKNPFFDFSSEDKRLRIYKKLGLYTEPDDCPIGTTEVSTACGKKLILEDKNITMVHIPLKNSLRQLLQIDGLFDALLEYMNILKEDKTALTNFIQGQLWEKQMSKFDKNGIALPLFGYFDDVETGNCIGSHAKINEVGAVYVTIPCLPPNFASKLDSILMTDIFYSNDRKQYGNAVVFKCFIKDLKDMRENGIEITIKGQQIKVFFITTLILGDNLGLNSILGFIASFSQTLWCRMCYASPDVMRSLTSEVEELLRTMKKYEEDVKKLSVAESGIKEKCIFHAIEDFDVIENSSVDVMHDVYEGVCNYTMAEILLKLVVDKKLLDIDYINYKLRCMDFGFETSNVPPPINLDYVKKNRRLKMSASESLFFARYFGIIVGDSVPTDNQYWRLYKKLRAVLYLVTAPVLKYTHILQLETFITEFNDLYIQLFGSLKPKFHILLHYVKMILKNGPVSKFSSMRFESHHRIIKLILLNSCSNREILKTVGTRYLLGLMKLQFSKYEDNYITYGSKLADDYVDTLFLSAKLKYALSNITINNCTFSKDTIIAVGFDNNLPIFGKIKKVFVVDDEIIFQYIPLITIGFNTHYFAHSVTMNNIHEKTVTYDSLAFKTACLLFEIDNTPFIIIRHTL